MKKSQILAALALAFALGVVAPVANTSALISGTAATVTELKDDLNAAIKSAKDLDDYDGFCNSTSGIVKAVTDAENDLKAKTNGATSSAFTTLKTNIINYNAQSTEGALAIDTNSFTTYESLKAVVEAKISSLEAALDTASAADVAKINADIANLENRLSLAQAVIDGVYASRTGAILTAIRTAGLVGDGDLSNIVAPYDEDDYDAVISVAKGGHYAQYASLCEAVTEAEHIINWAEPVYAPAAVRNAINNIIALVAAINGDSTDVPSLDPVEPEDPSDPSDTEDEDGKGGANAPAAGALAKADATAKATVSIMAAIASVATAAFVAIRKIAASKKA